MIYVKYINYCYEYERRELSGWKNEGREIVRIPNIGHAIFMYFD